MKIVLDFDDTIFNTHVQMHSIAAVFKKFNFSEEEFWNTYQECKKKVGDFNFVVMINLLSEIKSFDKIKAEKEMSLILNKAEDFVYSDFFDFVKSFNKKDLILLSFGTTTTQKIKINNSKVAEFFEDIIITSRDKAEDMKSIFEKHKKEKIFFIDDKAEQIDKVKEKLSQIIAIKVERSQGEHINNKSELADYVVKDLDEAKNIINKLNK